MGCGPRLTLTASGHIRCGNPDCPHPGKVDDLLDDPLSHVHVVRIRESDFTIQHPLAERGGKLMECEILQRIAAEGRAPVAPGDYIVNLANGQLYYQKVTPQ